MRILEVDQGGHPTAEARAVSQKVREGGKVVAQRGAAQWVARLGALEVPQIVQAKVGPRVEKVVQAVVKREQDEV